MRNVPAAILYLSLPAALQAQSFTLSAPLPTLVSMTSPAQSQSLPAGPLASQGTVSVGSVWAGPSALFGWESAADPTAAYFSSYVWLANTPTATGASAVTPGEIVLALSAPTTMQVDISLRGEFEGAISPQLWVDVFDDNVVEMSTPAIGNTVTASVTVTIGPVAVPVRTRLALAHAGQGSSNARLVVLATPRTRCTASRWSVGCGGAPYSAVPTFDGNIALVGTPMLNTTLIGVLGFDIQPRLLGHAGLPCVLFPSPDALVYFPTWNTMILPIPAAYRPLQFWTQGVAIDATQILVSDPFRVEAL